MASYLFHDPSMHPSRFRRYRIALLRAVRQAVVLVPAIIVAFYAVVVLLVVTLAAYSAYLQSVTP